MPETLERRPTLRDIGKKLGLSHAAVSMALRDHPRIPQERCAQIKALAEKMGYRPDPALVALSRYRHPARGGAVTAEIAWLNFWPEPRRLREHQEFDSYWRGAQAVAEAQGYRLVEYAPANGMPLKRIEQILKTRGVGGILLPPPPTSDMREVDFHAQPFDWTAFSLVRFGHRILSLPVHMVTCDQVSCASLAVAEMWKRGYRRIGFATTELGLNSLRFAPGFLRAQCLLPASAARLPILSLPKDAGQTSTRLLKAWLGRHRPDAIFSAVNGLPRLLKELGYRVPSDIALAATSVLEGGVDSGINQNSEEIGRTAMEFLISLIQNGHRGFPRIQRHLLVEGSWVDGASLPQLRAEKIGAPDASPSGSRRRSAQTRATTPRSK